MSVRVLSQNTVIDSTELASLSTDMCSTKALKATPHLLIVLDSDADYAVKGGTGEDLLYRWPGG